MSLSPDGNMEPCRVVIVIPVHSPEINEFERISLRQCLDVFRQHPKVLLCPEGMPLDEYHAVGEAFDTCHIPAQYLSSLDSYNRLKCSIYFYSLFERYDYLLTYELDSFVFRDELLEWCQFDYDYLGAPWFEGYHTCTPTASIAGVGNSGFSLRKIKTCLRLLRRLEGVRAAVELWGWHCGARTLHQRVIRRIIRISPKMLSFLQLIECPEEVHEDVFWCEFVAKAWPDFHVSPVEIAMRFSFEANPRVLFERNGYRLPFGVHAWYKMDLSFWKPYIERLGYTLPSDSSNASISAHSV